MGELHESIAERLRRERDARESHGLYYLTQVLLSFNSNHMEGSTLSAEQTAQIFETGAFLPETDKQVRVDDAVETANHFRAFSWLLDHVDDPVDEDLVCHLHAMLKHGTMQEADPERYNVGGYKTRANVIGALAQIKTAPPERVPDCMRQVFAACVALRDDPYDIASMHWMFERTHPFSDGNGRVGRLLLFKECLRIGTVPPLIRDENRNLYVRALTNFPQQPGYLVDLLLSERDFYRDELLSRFAAGEIDVDYRDCWSLDDAESRRRRDLDFASMIDAYGR
ncbi:cell filamentation protein Fic [Bifidobacterium lemurum]|uniref:Cell filamentation protein Fic n=1 Tax=Bifidobacterium lemurum TaxID=1603886 RepID=A0A261FL78_9BIFI|nr:Fic family protein [Bifidobacterium lemurum]OZG59932.1 cell filamentation protein Fic [Bifidobacterium lemurum]QOL33953.1 Fic family protein [Bifidobacterium lemurum]